MIKSIALSLIFIFLYIGAFNQKPSLDSTALNGWTSLYSPTICSNGRFVSYNIKNQQEGSNTLVIKSSNSSWEKQFTNAQFVFFSQDNRKAVLQQSGQLRFILLDENTDDQIVNIQSCNFPRNAAGEWLAYQEKENSGQLILLNVITQKDIQLGKVDRYWFGNQGKILVTESSEQNDLALKPTLQMIELISGKRYRIWSGKNLEKVSDIRFDSEEKKIVFIVTDKTSAKEVQSIWVYHLGQDKAVLKIADGDVRLTNRVIKKVNEFSKDGRWIFCTLRPPENVALTNRNNNCTKVDVWSYKDQYLQPEQLDRHLPSAIESVIDADGTIFYQLEKSGQKYYTKPNRLSPQTFGNWIIMESQDSSGSSDPRNNFAFPSVLYLYNLQTLKNRYICKDAVSLENASFSLDGNWLVYYDKIKNDYFSYEIKSAQLLNLTRNLTVKMNTESPSAMEAGNIFVTGAAADVVGWVTDGDLHGQLLVSDGYDIWQLDPSGRRQGENLTRGYGKQHHVKFSIANQKNKRHNASIYAPGDTILLSAFNTDNKYNGFFRMILGNNGAPEKLSMGPYTFYLSSVQLPPEDHSFSDGEPPVEANEAECWIVKRQSAQDAPNYFFTTDFRTYRQLSYISPQKAYNWLTSELITYKQLDGSTSQGVLYKPENFDPKTKYPVIFNFYEQLSHRLYQFPMPGFTAENINIPWFVSRGYLVFTPDIHYRAAISSGKTVGDWAQNSIVGAVNYLKKLPYVDSKHMGLQGHSFGGEQTNDLIAHTHLFAAAAEMSGTTDAVSEYLTMVPGNDNKEEFIERQAIAESGQGRFGGTLWELKNLYLRSSPVLYADKITTPLLMVHNKPDIAVQWRQGVELYMALRRLKKRAWMLQYDNGSHQLIKNEDMKDYTIRLTQFFDHYLKGAPPPKWMTQGIPAKLKGIETGYELDTSGAIP